MNNMVSILPTQRTYTKNIGFDGSGIHAKKIGGHIINLKGSVKKCADKIRIWLVKLHLTGIAQHIYWGLVKLFKTN